MDVSLQIQIISKNPDGSTKTIIREYSESTKQIEVTSTRFDTPAKLTFSCVESGTIGIPEGSSAELSVNGQKLFKGYIFTAERKRHGETSYVAYDQMRYLKANASYTFVGMTLGQIVQQIASDFGLSVGILEDTGYAFPCLIKENEGCLDILYDALSQTIVQTGRIFNLYDDCGMIVLKEAKNMFVNTLIGNGSLATEYTYKRDIDSDTYNRVKLVRKNEESGKTDVYMYEDTETIKKWGLLQYYDEVDENLNTAQIDAMCSQYLLYYNRVLQNISIDAIGNAEIRAGTIVPVQIGDIEDLSSMRLLIAEKVTHKIEGEIHTMSLEVKNFDQVGGMSIV